MLCDKCGKNEATVFVKQVINNKETKQHLCKECAEGIMDIGNFSLDKFFSGSHLNSPFESAFLIEEEEIFSQPKNSKSST